MSEDFHTRRDSTADNYPLQDFGDRAQTAPYFSVDMAEYERVQALYVQAEQIIADKNQTIYHQYSMLQDAGRSITRLADLIADMEIRLATLQATMEHTDTAGKPYWCGVCRKRHSSYTSVMACCPVLKET